MGKLGLVFAGGGGKGAYEVGVWKAFKEFGIDKNISAVSGTSVGGLNGALFTKGDFEQGLEVWQKMSPEKILQINPEQVISALGKIIPQTRILTVIGEKLGFLKSEGIFTQKGLESIIRGSLKDGELKDKIPLYICATDVSDSLSLKPIYKKLNDLDYETIVQYLLATSAIPVAFPKTEVEGLTLLDGFLADNTPMKPIIENEGCDKVIVVMLGRSETITKEKLNYPDVSFWEIVPSGNTKEGLGSLDFKSETANHLIEMGYNDTLKILQNLYEFMLIEQEYIEKGDTIRIQDNGFKKAITNNSILRSEYKQLEKNYSDTNSLAYLLSNPKHNKALVETSKKDITNIDTLKKELELSIDKFDIELIDNELDSVLKQMGNNSKEMSKFAFDSVTSLATNIGKINYQIEQGFFSRFIGAVTGSNHKLQADVNLNFSNAIYANTQMIKKLAQRNNLTLDMCIALGNKVNYLAQNQNHLQLQNNQQFKMIDGLRDAIFTLADITKNAIDNNTSRIEKLEYGQELLNWSHHIKASIKGLNSYDSIMKVVSGYHKITNRHEDDTSGFLYSTLINCGFDEISINPSAFVEYAVDNQDKELKLFEHADKSDFLPVPKSYESHIPIFASIGKIYDTQHIINYDDIASNLEDNYNLNLDTDISGVDFAFELYSGFKISGDIKKSLKESKKDIKDKLDCAIEILKNDKLYDIFQKDIEKLKNKIDDFKVIVPVIGKFSSGKSKLLNTYISNDTKLFEVDTNPTTAIASEIRYGTKNIVKLYDKDDNENEVNLEEFKANDTKDIVYLKYFLNYPKLQHRNDLVLVDMPGFESSNLNHNNAINRYFNKGHHYILALSCETTNDNSILKHIKEILSYGAKFSVIITKSDKKLPKHIDELTKVVRNNILHKYPNEDFFIGVTSSFKNRLEDFEKIVDSIYEDSNNIFKYNIQDNVAVVLENIKQNYKKILNAPNDTIEFEKKIVTDKQMFEDEISKLNAKLNELKFTIISDGKNRLTDKTKSVLEANISSLASSAKSNTLSNTITELLRPSLNSLFKNIIEESLNRVQKESLSISNDLNFSLSISQIDTELGFFGTIKNFLFNTLEKEIKEKLRNNTIPNVVNDISNNITQELETLFENIKKSVDEQIINKRRKSEQITQEIKEQMSLKTEEFEELQSNYKESLEKLERL